MKNVTNLELTVQVNSRYTNCLGFGREVKQLENKGDSFVYYYFEQSRKALHIETEKNWKDQNHADNRKSAKNTEEICNQCVDNESH